jgi:ligand-binding sensor domain-containing protein
MNAISFTQLWVVLVLVLLTKGTTAQNNQIRNYTLADGLPQSQVYDIVQDEVGYLWVGSQGGGLSSFDGLQFNVWNERNGLLSNYIQTLQFISTSADQRSSLTTWPLLQQFFYPTASSVLR